MANKKVIPSLKGYGGVRPKQLQNSSTIAKHREGIATEMLCMATTSIRDIMEWDEYGNVKLKASKDIPEYAHRAIKKVTTTTDKDGRVSTSVELHDKTAALRILAKAAGLLEPEQNMDKPSVIGFNVKAPEIIEDGEVADE
jgi:N-acetylglutamate synthase/N-acetylornithine aminotransferase